MHGNHPNKSEAWRAVQYIRAMPTSGTPYRPFATHLNLYNSSFRPSTLGRKVFATWILPRVLRLRFQSAPNAITQKPHVLLNSGS